MRKKLKRFQTVEIYEGPRDEESGEAVDLREVAAALPVELRQRLAPEPDHEVDALYAYLCGEGPLPTLAAEGKRPQ